MGRVHRPRHGSLQFWPRKKSKKPYAEIKAWVKTKNPSLLGFAGYKAGMTHIVAKDLRPNSLTKGEEVVWPVTVIECPALKIYSIRFYKKTSNGLTVASEILNPKLEKELSKKVNASKKKDFDSKVKEISSKVNDFYDLRVNVYTQPKRAGFGKKKPEIFEIGVGGSSVKDKLDFILGLLEKEISVNEVLKEGVKVDIHGVTRGKGFQGVIKRFGAQLRSHKSEKKRRGSIKGPEMPGKTLWTALMPGRMGYNLRTEYNKDILMIGNDPQKINPKGGFLHYGLVKNNFVLIKGSVPGHVKRLVTLTEPIRGSRGFGQNMQIQYISTESKQ